jgi:hypothetical protein
VFALWQDAAGNATRSARLLQTGQRGAGFGAAVDSPGDIVIVRGFSGEVSGAGYRLQSAGGSDLFVGKFDATGAHLWSQRLGGPRDEAFGVVTTDGGDRVFVAGSTTGSIDLGFGPLASAGRADIFLAALTPLGAPIGAAMFRNDYLGGAAALRTDGQGQIYLAGTFANDTQLGGADLVAEPGGPDPIDAFIAKWAW